MSDQKAFREGMCLAAGIAAGFITLFWVLAALWHWGPDLGPEGPWWALPYHLSGVFVGFGAAFVVGWFTFWALPPRISGIKTEIWTAVDIGEKILPGYLWVCLRHKAGSICETWNRSEQATCGHCGGAFEPEKSRPAKVE